ncbi:50S ribosomal protein L15, chloroplastic [Herrania umbratica]|uniref:50S ribosomal protein L15, chloroplastic n=1 Tax=Herrania umbratica TaxID=108875 RepID=A0A6J1BHX1_9ROSI|nr:50S ribosomal protein L15, chloroplastic [Herrania umbratica]
MAAMLSLSPNPPITTSISLHSAFRGNVRNLGPNPCHIILIRTKRQQQQKQQGTRSLVVVSRAAKIQVAVTAPTVRFRLDNLGPQPGSRKKGKRKGRGISAGQGGSCGFGMRGQKSRSGPGVRKGFEGGQMPLYRRIPKLRGIAGGMHAGLPKYIPVNLKDIETAGFLEGDEVSLETLKKKGLINPSGRERKLPLKILGDGELNVKLNFKARAFSASAKEKLEASGCSLTVLPGRKKWVKPSVAKNLARADEYFAKKRAPAAESNSA